MITSARVAPLPVDALAARREADVAYSSIEHMGSSPSPSASAAAGEFHGLLHGRHLTNPASCRRHVARSWTQKIADIRGLTVTHPLLGWGLVLGVAASRPRAS
jgi:hydrogenase-4 component F